MCFLTLAQKDIYFSSYHLKDKYMELKDRKRMQLKSSILPSYGMVPKESRILKRFGKWTHMEMFSPLKILNSPFSKERDFGSFSSFLVLFLCLFLSLFFYALSLTHRSDSPVRAL
jgi:hypothetical protein